MPSARLSWFFRLVDYLSLSRCALPGACTSLRSRQPQLSEAKLPIWRRQDLGVVGVIDRPSLGKLLPHGASRTVSLLSPLRRRAAVEVLGLWGSQPSALESVNLRAPAPGRGLDQCPVLHEMEVGPVRHEPMLDQLHEGSAVPEHLHRRQELAGMRVDDSPATGRIKRAAMHCRSCGDCAMPGWPPCAPRDCLPALLSPGTPPPPGTSEEWRRAGQSFPGLVPPPMQPCDQGHC
jgi:hypothetical protein